MKAGAAQERVGRAARWILLLVVRSYITFLSPFFGGACKFYPSCSQYAQEAIARHGARRGAWLAMKRLGRCRPFTQGGYDPVPEEIEGSEGRGAGDGAAASQALVSGISGKMQLPTKLERPESPRHG